MRQVSLKLAPVYSNRECAEIILADPKLYVGLMKLWADMILAAK